jgi:peptidoglycan/xylan/chitin deacetylase (PgdA/CDA1 family)
VSGDLGLKIAYWSSWGLDWEEAGAGEIEQAVRSGMKRGAVVLLHDTARYGRRRNAAPTAHAVDAIVADGRHRGWSWRTLSDAADRSCAGPSASAIAPPG